MYAWQAWSLNCRRPRNFSCAMMSRRKFIGAAAGTTGAILGSGLWMPQLALAAGSAPKPIPGGIVVGGQLFHVFLLGEGNEPSTITDFNVGQDFLRIDHNLFSSVSDVLSHSKDSSEGTVISYDAANTITLVGVHVADLQAHQDHVQLF